jgi:hypothetical protein
MRKAAKRTARRHYSKAPKPSILTKSLKRLYFKSRKLDAARRAKRPGWRTSASGKRYYEARVNRSDRLRHAPRGRRL